MTKNSSGHNSAGELIRLAVVFIPVFLALLWIGHVLYDVQIDNWKKFAKAQDSYSARRVRLPATRGRILARDGEPLADNAPSYCVAIFVEELRKSGNMSNTVNAVDKLVAKIEDRIKRPREVTRADIESHIARRRALPLIAFSELDWAELACYAENQMSFPGSDVFVRPKRTYPNGTLAPHIIGYVGRGQPDSVDIEDDKFHFYLPDLKGRAGIESEYDTWLAGIPGGELIRVDVSGYKSDADMIRPPVPGRDVRLSLKMDLQEEANASLAGLRGAIVMMDCNNGDILAMVSAPGYDVSDFSPRLPSALWKELMDDPRRPIVNRATQGIYPPGSIVKPVVAIAALDSGTITREQRLNCVGYYQMPNGSRLRCSHRYGHGGPIDVEQALKFSCNTFFCDIGVSMGYEPTLRAAYAALGLGARPEIEIPASSGVLPSAEWKRARFRDGWRVGDTANISIGQGFLSVTPLQMAVMTCAIANGGHVLRPHLVIEPARDEDNAIRQIPWKRSSLAAVRKGMVDVVNAPDGTGRRAKLEGAVIAGKTGTAEYYDRGAKLKHSWMIAYAPAEDPKYAMAVVVEDSDSGGKAAAPIVHKMMAKALGLRPNPGIAVETNAVTTVEAPHG